MAYEDISVQRLPLLVASVYRQTFPTRPLRPSMSHSGNYHLDRECDSWID